MAVFSSELVTGATRANQIDDVINTLMGQIMDALATTGLASDVTINAAIASLASNYFDELRVVGVDSKNGIRIHNSTGDFQIRLRAEGDYNENGIGPADAIILEYAGTATSGDMDTVPTFTDYLVITADTIWHPTLGDLEDLAAVTDVIGGTNISVSGSGDLTVATDTTGASDTGQLLYSNGGTGAWTDPALWGHCYVSGASNNVTVGSVKLGLSSATAQRPAAGFAVSANQVNIPADGIWMFAANINVTQYQATSIGAMELQLWVGGTERVATSFTVAGVTDEQAGGALTWIGSVTSGQDAYLYLTGTGETINAVYTENSLSIVRLS